jgi:ATP-binding cassette, subfamily B (MDR/TAP), member 1
MMAGELSEKAEAQSHRTSSHGDSTDEHESTRKQKTEPDAIQVLSNDPAALTKLDSNVKVEVKDEDLYAHLPDAEAQILRRQVDITDTPQNGTS